VLIATSEELCFKPKGATFFRLCRVWVRRVAFPWRPELRCNLAQSQKASRLPTFWAALGGISIQTCEDALRVEQVVTSNFRKWAAEQHKRAGQVRFWPTTCWPCWQPKSCLDSERGGSVCKLSLLLFIAVACQQGVSDISVYSLCFRLAVGKEKGGEGTKNISYFL
jgi:hypothetical protein